MTRHPPASDAEAEAPIRDLRTRDCSIEAILEQNAVGRLATVNRRRDFAYELKQLLEAAT